MKDSMPYAEVEVSGSGNKHLPLCTNINNRYFIQKPNGHQDGVMLNEVNVNTLECLQSTHISVLQVAPIFLKGRNENLFLDIKQFMYLLNKLYNTQLYSEK